MTVERALELLNWRMRDPRVLRAWASNVLENSTPQRPLRYKVAAHTIIEWAEARI